MTAGYYRVMASGHRTLPSGTAPWVQEQIDAVVAQLSSKYGMRRAMSGMALGVDQMFALAALRRGIRVDAYIPGRDQSIRWSDEQRSEYANLIARAATVQSATDASPYATYISRLHLRNEQMIRDCDLAVLILDDRQSGGTYSVKMKLAAAGKPTIHIDPTNKTVTASWPLQK
jgi:uncharacterized phage-like protein YoqJ